MPTLFLSHGSPMHALEPGQAGAAWQSLAASIPRPRAVLVASAHWEASAPRLTGAARLETIHDFGGFPEPLYQIRYDAPGAPDLARAASDLLREAGFAPALDPRRGIDHGAWVPLKWMYPEVDVPVVQVSVQTALGTAHHMKLGEALAPLTGQGVLVLGSGHATHNLHDWFRYHAADKPLEYVQQFSEWLAQRLASDDRDEVLHYRERAPHATRAHPSEEHFLPLFVAWGAAGPRPRVVRAHASIDGAALAMDAYLFEPTSGVTAS
ncbi:MAG: dioxygenase [Gammaproteobacteria bacterium]|nr:dioxygenase [Gammaproteobacteria bacterium]